MRIPSHALDRRPLDIDDMRLIATRKEEQNRSVIDPWTVVHFAAGLAAGLVRFPRDWALTSAIAYELAEQYAERESWGQEFFETSRPESVANALADVAVFMVGHRLGEAWNDTGSVEHVPAVERRRPPDLAKAVVAHPVST